VVVTDRTGVAIPGATVTLSVAPATGTLTPAGPTAVTDAGGSATFTGLGVSPIGTYRIVATVTIAGVGSFRTQSQQFTVYQLL